MIRVANVGKSIAYDVKFRFSEPMVHKAFGIPRGGKNREAQPITSGPLMTGIPALGPGDYREITWGQFGGLADHLGGRQVRVTCTFESHSWLPWGHGSHVVESVLEVESYAGTDASAPIAVELVRHIEKISETLKRMERRLAQTEGQPS